MNLLLVRHGETEWNATLRYQGHAQIPLNQRGRTQAMRVGERLAAENVVALYTSDLLRAHETATIVGEALKLRAEALPDLREIDVGQWEGLTPEELYRRYPEHMQEFDRDPARTVRLGGESYAQLQQRALQALQLIETRHSDGTVVAVSHGGTIRALLCHVIGLDLGYFGRIWLDNGSISELRYRKGSWRLLGLNDRCHLAGIDPFAGGE
jgi:alpha-ribazole phosphatase